MIFPIEEILPVQPIDVAEKVGASGYSFRVTEEGDSHVALMIGETDEATRIAWDFFSRHTFSGNEEPDITASSEVVGSKIKVAGSASDPDPDGAIVKVDVIIKKRVGSAYEDFKKITLSENFPSFEVTSDKCLSVPLSIDVDDVSQTEIEYKLSYNFLKRPVN